MLNQSEKVICVKTFSTFEKVFTQMTFSDWLKIVFCLTFFSAGFGLKKTLFVK